MPPGPLPPYEQELRAFLAPLGVDLDAQAVVFQLYRTSTDVIAALEATALRPLGLSHTGFALLVPLWARGRQGARGAPAPQRPRRGARAPAAQAPRRRPQLRRSRGRVGGRAAGASHLLQQAVDVRHRPLRPDPPAARLAAPRL